MATTFTLSAAGVVGAALLAFLVLRKGVPPTPDSEPREHARATAAELVA